MPETFAEWISFIASLFTIVGITGVATWGLSQKQHAITTTLLIVFISRLIACIALLLIYASIGFRFANTLYLPLYSIFDNAGEMFTGDWHYEPNHTALNIIVSVPTIILIFIMYAATCILIYRGWEPLKNIILILLHKKPMPSSDTPQIGSLES